MSDKTCLENMPQKNVTLTERYCRIKEARAPFLCLPSGIWEDLLLFFLLLGSAANDRVIWETSGPPPRSLPLLKRYEWDGREEGGKTTLHDRQTIRRHLSSNAAAEAASSFLSRLPFRAFRVSCLSHCFAKRPF